MRLKDIQNVQFEEKRDSSKLNVTAKACAGKEVVTIQISAIKEPNLHWTRGRGALGVRPRPLKPSAWERKRSKGYSDSREEQTKAACKYDLRGQSPS